MSGGAERQPALRIRDPRELAEIALQLRRKVIELVAPTGQGYVQQGLGAADLFAVLYFAELRLDPADPDWTARDRLLLSTAHNTAIFYATLAQRGLVPAAKISDYCKDGSPFEVNASERVGTVVEATCGSLGQGLSVAIGMALAARRRGDASRIYVILGDGELQEGQVWEAALLAGSLGLDNLCLLIDDNRMQVEGHVDGVVKLEPIAGKFASFGWAQEVVDGHDIPALLGALDRARGTPSRPTCLVVRTLAGKGVPMLEGILAHNLKLPADVATAAMAALSNAGDVP
ncbi:transketolase [Bosea sp. BE125]|uniref:transketolase n=1 Tax=Bosea sp. BE125 TaxID=2817909 RepID=UPI002866DDC5|nr:transketolase [Bosea sp. BE125]MDR6870837.1 transketolase [Bosea sp. BE125]